MASTAKKASAPKKSAAKAPSHPPYIEMVKEALVALKERTGSSTYAIAKHIEEQQKVGLPPNFKKLLSVQLKKSVASGKLVKVKNSYKLAPTVKKSAEEPKPKAKPVVKPKAAAEKVAKKPAAKPKAAAEKPKKAAPAKAKAKTVTKPKAVAKPAKAVKAVKVVAKSPAKKVAATKAKKVVEKAKKPKSIKSPAKKAPVAKKAKK